MPLWTDPRPTVLLTGFGPFPGVRRNASASLVKWLSFKAQIALPHCRFVAAVLPTEWTRAPRILAELYERHDPALALHFGVATNMRGFRIETEARNFCRMSPDAAGSLPVLNRVFEDGAPALPVTIAVTSIARHLEAQGYNAALSDDAGGYLCNAVLYHSISEARDRGGRCKVGFIHVPADAKLRDTVGYAVPGAVEILKVALDARSPAPILTSV